MQVYTETKQALFNTIGKIKAEYYELMAQPEAQKTAVYASLATKYGKSTRTIQGYVKKK